MALPSRARCRSVGAVVAQNQANSSLRAARASLLDLELQRCVDGAAVLRVGAQTQMQLTLADLRSFLARLRDLKKMPASGSDLRQFLEKARVLAPEMLALSLVTLAMVR